jgi:hypothetical protein
MTQSQVVQATSYHHHQIAHPVTPVAQLVLDHPTPLHTAHRVLNAHLLTRNAPVGFFLLLRQSSASRLLAWLRNHHALDRKALKAHILVEHASCWKHVDFIIHQRLVMPFSCICRTQEADLAGLVDQQNVLDRVTLLLAAVILLLFVRI